MRRVRRNNLFWAAMAAAVFLTSGCSTTAYKEYLTAADAFNQCVKQSGNSDTRCVPERENLDGVLSKYEREAERNYWWRNAVEDVREKDALAPYDRKPK